VCENGLGAWGLGAPFGGWEEAPFGGREEIAGRVAVALLHLTSGVITRLSSESLPNGRWGA